MQAYLLIIIMLTGDLRAEKITRTYPSYAACVDATPDVIVAFKHETPRAMVQSSVCHAVPWKAALATTPRMS